MKNLVLCDRTVKVDDKDLFISLTDMWYASGGDGKNQPSLFLMNESSKKYIAALDLNIGIPSLRIQHGGNKSGTWAHKLLAYKYASWIDPDFEIGAYTVLDNFFSGNLKRVTYDNELHEYTERLIKHEKEGSFYGRALQRIKIKKKELIEEGEELLNRHQLSLLKDIDKQS